MPISTYLVQFQKRIKERLESTGHQLSLDVEDKKQKLTVNWVTWLCIDCCCDTYPACQRFPAVAVSCLWH